MNKDLASLIPLRISSTDCPGVCTVSIRSSTPSTGFRAGFRFKLIILDYLERWLLNSLRTICPQTFPSSSFEPGNGICSGDWTPKSSSSWSMACGDQLCLRAAKFSFFTYCFATSTDIWSWPRYSSITSKLKISSYKAKRKELNFVG